MLKDILIQQIKDKGPLDLYTYTSLCQTHPIYGYYSSKVSTQIIGDGGDFITAPEISPLFGEMIAIWVVSYWEQMGKPKVLHLVELGPGQGILMQDVVLALQKINLFSAECVVHFVEVNPSFQQLQKEKLQPLSPVFDHASLEFLEEIKEPTIIIANEFFDALPVRQYINHGNVWYEKGVGVDDKNELKMVHLPQEIEPDDMECQPDIEGILEKICDHIHRRKGAALLIDYGYWEGEGDSLQAVYKHQKVGILDYPGEADLSVHVNFKKMALQCKKGGVHYNFRTQRQFLMDLGIQLRLELICRNMDIAKATELRGGVQRLIDPLEMGQLFKVLEIWKN